MRESVLVPRAARTIWAASASMSDGTGWTAAGSRSDCRGEPGQRQGLDAERQVHHLGRVAVGGDQVDHAPLGQQEQAAAVGELVGVGVRADIGLHADRQGGQRPHVDLDVEVAGVGEDGAVPHHRQVLAGDHVGGAGRGDEHLADRGRVGQRQHQEAAQHRVERPHRVNLGDHHPRAQGAGGLGDADPAGAEPGHHHGLARQQDPAGAQQPVDDRLSGAVPVVHQPGDGRVAGRDDRERERAVGRHPAQPEHAGRRPLAPSAHPVERRRQRSRVQGGDQVTAVVEDQVGAVGVACAAGCVGAERERDVLVVRVPVHPGPGEDLHPVAGPERGGDVVLGGERVGRRQPDQRAAGPQRAHEHRRLRRHVQAGGDGHAVERALRAEPRSRAPTAAAWTVPHS